MWNQHNLVHLPFSWIELMCADDLHLQDPMGASCRMPAGRLRPERDPHQRTVRTELQLTGTLLFSETPLPSSAFILL